MRDDFSDHHGFKLLGGLVVLLVVVGIAGAAVYGAIRSIGKGDLTATAEDRLDTLERDGAMQSFVPKSEEVESERRGRCGREDEDPPRVVVVYRSSENGFVVLDAFNKLAGSNGWKPAAAQSGERDGEGPDSVDYEKSFGKGENAWTGRIELTTTELDGGDAGFEVVARAEPTGCSAEPATTSGTTTTTP